jgi:hypothetical protein
MPLRSDPETGLVIKLALQQVMNTGSGDVNRLRDWLMRYWSMLPFPAKLEVYTYLTRTMHKERRGREQKPGMVSLSTEYELEQIFAFVQNNMGV